jgi:hypothetical protein
MAGAASLQRDKGAGIIDRDYNNSEIGTYHRKPIMNDALDWPKNDKIDKQTNREQYPNRRISQLEKYSNISKDGDDF